MSDKYVNAHYKLCWKCDKGHIWDAEPNSVKSGSWCPYCAGKFKTIEEIQKIAEKKGGRCLSEKYIGSKYKLLWECENGHTWCATAGHIILGTWCPICGGTKKLTLRDMQQIAKDRNGKLLSEHYINTDSNLEWQCNMGHTWKARPTHIKRGSWCPHCSKISGLNERICRVLFESIFDEKFNKEKPKWLLTKSGTKLELDGYNSNLKIAFEYHGRQHFESISHFKSDMQKRQDYDLIKRNTCKNKGITLIEIPYTVKTEALSEYVLRKCKEDKLPIKNYHPELNSKVSNIYSENFLNELKNIAEHKGGKCLSNIYFGNNVKLKFQCKLKHIWEGLPTNIKKGSWCPVYSGHAKLEIHDLKRIAKSRGGKCLSNECKSARTKVDWQCKFGHTWKAVPDSVKRGTWCPYCSGRHNLSIEKIKEYAEKLKGKCLSNSYTNAITMYEWQCDKEHIWKANANSVMQGSWCPVCGGTQKSNIQAMNELAKKHNGKCLSEKYFNNKTKLNWQCENGHIWETVPKVIKRGCWCPICVGKKK